MTREKRLRNTAVTHDDDLLVEQHDASKKYDACPALTVLHTQVGKHFLESVSLSSEAN